MILIGKVSSCEFLHLVFNWKLHVCDDWRFYSFSDLLVGLSSFLSNGEWNHYILNVLLTSQKRLHAAVASNDVTNNNRAVFNWVSKVICVCFGFTLPRSVIGKKISHAAFRPIRSKANTNRDLVARVFPRLVLLSRHVFPLIIILVDSLGICV